MMTNNSFDSRFFRIIAGTLVSLALLLAVSSTTVFQAAFMSGRDRLPVVQVTPSSTTGNGLRTVTIDSKEGRVVVKVPDDIRTGDKISGTLIDEPNGKTEDEQSKNRTAMRAKMIRLILARATNQLTNKGDKAADAMILTVPLSGDSTSTVQTTRGGGNATRIEFTAVAPRDLALAPDVYKASDELGTASIPIDVVTPVEPKKAPKPAQTPVKKTPGQHFLAESMIHTVFEPEPAPTFNIPPLGQTGRPIPIAGPFDGSSSNTSIDLATGKDPALPSEIKMNVIAESPRKAIVECPQEFMGPGHITVTERGEQASGPFRNVGVFLGAPKTSLLKGESTEMRIQVTGLTGITTPIPLTLESSGVVTMSGGPYQSLTIQPSQVKADGSYSTTRSITGVQAGGWGATATVIIPDSDCFIRSRYIDFLARDDQDQRSGFWVSSFNGDFGVTAPDGSTFDGTGTISLKGCIIELNYDKSGVRVEATVDACGKTATATVKEPKLRFTITDRNTTDNICACASGCK